MGEKIDKLRRRGQDCLPQQSGEILPFPDLSLRPFDHPDEEERPNSYQQQWFNRLHQMRTSPLRQSEDYKDEQLRSRDA